MEEARQASRRNGVRSSQWPAETGKHVPKSSSQAPWAPCQVREPRRFYGSLAGSTSPSPALRAPSPVLRAPRSSASMANSTGCGPHIRWLPFSKWVFRKSKSPIFCWNYWWKHIKSTNIVLVETAWIRIFALWFYLPWGVLFTFCSFLYPLP